MYKYHIVIEPDDNDTYLITCPDLPEVTTFSETKDDIINHATGAINEAIAARVAYSRPLPQPSNGTGPIILPDPQLVIKALLIQAMADEGINRAELMRRLDTHRTAIDRLFMPNIQSPVSKYQQAFLAMGKSLDVSLTDIAA